MSSIAFYSSSKLCCFFCFLSSTENLQKVRKQSSIIHRMDDAIKITSSLLYAPQFPAGIMNTGNFDWYCEASWRTSAILYPSSL